MYYNPKRYQSMPVGVVVRKTPGVTKWSEWSWAVSAVLPGAGPAENRILRTEGDSTEYHFSTVNIELHGAETEAYMAGLASKIPSVYVVLREQAGAEIPLEVLLVTASPYEAQDYTDSGEEIVEKVPMPVGLIAWVRDFIENHHVEEALELFTSTLTLKASLAPVSSLTPQWLKQKILWDLMITNLELFKIK